jgi:hypothetical protein
MSKRTAIHVITELHVRRTESDEGFHDRVEAVMEELVAIEQSDDELSDATVSGDAGAGQVVVELLVLTDDPLYAITRSAAAIRAAVHAAGHGTPGWPDNDELALALDQASTRTEAALIAV